MSYYTHTFDLHVLLAETNTKIHCHILIEITIWNTMFENTKTEEEDEKINKNTILGVIAWTTTHRTWAAASHFSWCTEQRSPHRIVWSKWRLLTTHRWKLPDPIENGLENRKQFYQANFGIANSRPNFVVRTQINQKQ